METQYSSIAQLWFFSRGCIQLTISGIRRVSTMASSIPHLRLHLYMIGTLAEYDFLQAHDLTTLEPWQIEYLRERIQTLELEARIRSTLPYDVQRQIHRHTLRDAEPIDITNLANHIAPSYYTDPHAKFDYWRYTPFVYPTDNIHDAVMSSNALEFVEDVLLNPDHMARLHTLNPPKQITFEILIRWDFLPHFIPEVSLPNIDALFDLLGVFNGDVDRIRLEFLFKDITVNYSRDPSTKREIAPNNQGRLRIMRAKMLDLLQTAMAAYRDFFHAPQRITSATAFGLHMNTYRINHPMATNDVLHMRARDWIADHCCDLFDRMWDRYRRRAGFVKYHMLQEFRMGQEYYDRDLDVQEYIQNGMGIPFLPMPKDVYF